MEKINEGMVQDFCPDCGALVWKGDIGYISQNPNGSDMAREEAMLRHHSGACPASGDFDHIEICPHCGDEVGRWDCEYISRNPNGSDLAISQALEEHREVCPVIQAHLWAEWREEIDTTIHGRITVDEDTTPRQVLTRLLEAGLDFYIREELPCPPDRDEAEWPWSDLSDLVDIKKIRRRVEDRLRKDRGNEILRLAASMGVL